MTRFMATAAVLSFVALAAAACNTPQERALGGGALGAAGGALVGQAIGGNTGATVAGAVVGGLAGAMLGAGTAPGQCRYQQLDSRGRPMYDRNGNPMSYEAACR